MLAVATNLGALIAKSIYLMVYHSSGEMYGMLDVVYLVLHSLSEGIVIVIVLLVGHGWTITYV